VRRSAELSGEAFLPSVTEHAAEAGKRAAMMLCGASATLGIITLLLWASRFHNLVPYTLIFLAGAELFIVNRATRATMDPTPAMTAPAAWSEGLASVKPHERVLLAPFDYANLGMVLGYENLQGYDPGILKRYAEVIYTSLNLGRNDFDLRKASQYNLFTHVNVAVFRMLRCRLAFGNGPPIEVPDPLPQAVLVTDVFQPPSKLQLLQYICGDGFNPARTAVTETPMPFPAERNAEPAGTVSIKNLSMEQLEITANLTKPALLVITDNYSKGWRVMPATGIAADYSVIPANHTLIGIPLRSGSHHFILEYSPLSFRIGRWISLAALVTLLTTSVLLMRRRLKFR
jgi:hypothetical protein